VNQGFTFAVSDGAATEFFQIAIGQDSVSQSYGQYFVVSAGQTHPIKPSDITGDIVLQIVFDDALDQISSAFSLDGGITFQAFSNAYTFNVIPSGMFVLLGGQNLCGDGVIDPGEACDDANVNSGDGCDMGCQVEACFSCAGSPSVCPPIVACSDEEDGCCPAGCEPDTDSDCLCAGLPRTSCRRPTESGNSVLLVRVPGGTSGTLVWKWVKRAETNAGDFGEPLTETEYRLCAYHRFGLAGGPRLAVNATAAAGGTCGGKPCWRPIGSTGFKYKDKERRSDGLNTLLLKAGTAGKARLLAKGKGPNLQIRQLPLITPVTVQLQATNGVCWEAVYTTPLKSDETQFKARAD
jgi:cysteine-rich repeat protein